MSEQPLLPNSNNFHPRIRKEFTKKENPVGFFPASASKIGKQSEKPNKLLELYEKEKVKIKKYFDEHPNHYLRHAIKKQFEDIDHEISKRGCLPIYLAIAETTSEILEPKTPNGEIFALDRLLMLARTPSLGDKISGTVTMTAGFVFYLLALQITCGLTLGMMGVPIVLICVLLSALCLTYGGMYQYRGGISKQEDNVPDTVTEVTVLGISKYLDCPASEVREAIEDGDRGIIQTGYSAWSGTVSCKLCN